MPIDESDLVPNMPRAIATSIVLELRSRLNLNEDNCYVAAAPGWVDGNAYDKIIQVVPGSAGPWGEGEGGQEGGNVFRDQQYTLYLYFNTQIDPQQMTEAALLEVTDGVLDFCELVRQMMTGATFGNEDGPFGQQIIACRFRNEGQTTIEDADKVLLSRPMTFSVPYAIPFITNATITPTVSLYTE